MGSIESYDTAKGRRYRALYRRPDKKQTQKRGFTTKKAAELFLATTEVDIAQGRYAHFVEHAFNDGDHDWGVFSLSLLSRTPEFRQAAA